ncbi:MAG: hypothetical protein ACYDC7_00185 [Acidithiobacillus ferrivorans]
MKKNLVALAVAAAFVVPGVAFASTSSNRDTGPVVFGYAQITGAQQFGTGPGSSSGLVFGANRIRLGFKGEAVPGVTYYVEGAYDDAGLGIDGLNNGLGGRNVTGARSQAQLMDAWINFAPVPFAQLQVGKFKTPEGLEYTSVAGNELPFIYRNMGQSLLPGRSAGAMFHANDVMGTGVGYAVGIFDNTSLDTGTAFTGLGNIGLGGLTNAGQAPLMNGNGSYIVSGMLKYSMGSLLTAEVSGSLGNTKYGNPLAPVPRYTDQISSYNFGVTGGLMGISYGAGYTQTNGGISNGYLGSVNETTGTGTVNANDWHAELAVNFYKMKVLPLDIEPAVRFDQYHVSDVNGTAKGAGTLQNTTIGVNYFVNPNNPHAAEIQLNYIIPTNRGGAFANPYGSNGYDAPMNGAAYNTLMLQFQAGF